MPMLPGMPGGPAAWQSATPATGQPASVQAAPKAKKKRKAPSSNTPSSSSGGGGGAGGSAPRASSRSGDAMDTDKDDKKEAADERKAAAPEPDPEPPSKKPKRGEEARAAMDIARENGEGTFVDDADEWTGLGRWAQVEEAPPPTPEELEAIKQARREADPDFAKAEAYENRDEERPDDDERTKQRKRAKKLANKGRVGGLDETDDPDDESTLDEKTAADYGYSSIIARNKSFAEHAVNAPLDDKPADLAALLEAPAPADAGAENGEPAVKVEPVAFKKRKSKNKTVKQVGAPVVTDEQDD